MKFPAGAKAVDLAIREAYTVMDPEVRLLQSNLDELAEALLILVNDGATPEAQREKFRKLARGAVTRSEKLPSLTRGNRAAWLQRTKKFADAVSRVLLEYLDLRLP